MYSKSTYSRVRSHARSHQLVRSTSAKHAGGERPALSVLPNSLAPLVGGQLLTAEQLAELSHAVYRSRIWTPLVVVNSGFRDYRLLFENEHTELWVLSWMPGQIAGFHDHDVSGVGICVCEGRCWSSTFACMTLRTAMCSPPGRSRPAAQATSTRSRTIAARRPCPFTPTRPGSTASGSTAPTSTDCCAAIRRRAAPPDSPEHQPTTRKEISP